MKSTSSNKWLKIAVIILLIANTATLSLLWIGRPGNRPGPHTSPFQVLVKELGFTPDQEAKYLELVEEHRSSVDALRKKIAAEKENMYLLLKQENVTDSMKREAARKPAHYMEEIDIATLTHFQAVRQLCTPEQQIKFDKLLERISQLMQPAPPPGMPPGAPPPQGTPPPPRD